MKSLFPCHLKKSRSTVHCKNILSSPLLLYLYIKFYRFVLIFSPAHIQCHFCLWLCSKSPIDVIRKPFNHLAGFVEEGHSGDAIHGLIQFAFLYKMLFRTRPEKKKPTHTHLELLPTRSDNMKGCY